MRTPVRTRLVLWLFAAILPTVSAGVIAINAVGGTLVESAESDLLYLLELEVGRIEAALDEQSTAVTNAAIRPSLIEAVERITTPTDDDSLIADGGPTFAIKLAEAELRQAVDAGFALAELRLVDRDGLLLGQSNGFSWIPSDDSIALTAMDRRSPQIGDAFMTNDGNEHLGIAVAVIADDGAVLGALLAETRLATVVDLGRRLEGRGRTSEALIVQQIDSTSAEAITLRRFDRNAAFEAIIDLEGQTPSALALRAADALVVDQPDYRGVDTIAAVQTIEGTNWAVIVKIDRDEAYAIANYLQSFVWIALTLTLAIVLIGWLIFVRPIGKRLLTTAEAADRVASGDYNSRIGDTTSDEIGELAGSIDRLATDLAADIAARERAEDQLRYQANHDALTGLKNRQYAQSTIDQRERDAGEPYAVLFLDLDGFKEINDTHGHSVGDDVLISISKRLVNAVPSDALVARWGGDEFIVVLADHDAAQTADLSSELNRILRKPVVSSHGQHSIGASIGCALSSDYVDGAETILAADAEMFRSKHNRRSSRTISPAAIRLVETALSENRVRAFLQPVVQVCANDSVSLVGAEALVRIEGVDGEIVPPMEFLPALGSNELAAAVDAHVMVESFQHLAKWHTAGIVPESFRIALNVGPASVADPTYIERLAGELCGQNITPAWVLIEIPETVESVEPAKLEQLRSLGVGLAIDDVGVAYSNLERMVDLDADIAKLDRRWIPDLATADRSKFDVLHGLIEQCRSLGLDVIAEGVETHEQVAMLRDLGVDVFQGFFFGRPISTFDFERTWCSNFATTTEQLSSMLNPTSAR